MAFNRDTFVIYDEQTFTGMSEVLEQAAIEMGASNGTVTFDAVNLRGERDQSSFFAAMAEPISDRDPNDMGAATWQDLTMAETVGIKVHRKSKVEKAVNAFKALGQTPELASFVYGQQVGKGLALDMTNAALASLVAAIGTEADAVYDATANTDPADQVISPAKLVKVRAKFGDASGRIRAWVMHSALAHELLGDAADSIVSTVAGPAIFQGNFGTLGLPIIVTDSPYLYDDVTGEYFVLGLTQGAARLTESEDREMLTRRDDSKENITLRISMELAYTVNLLGYSWDGGNHPSVADLADGANWDKVFTDIKSTAGVLGKFKLRG